MADPQVPVTPGMSQMMGYGINPNQNNDKQWQLAAALAAMPDTGRANKLMDGGAPEGQMIGNIFVPPSFTQQLDGVAGNALGAKMMNNRNKQAKDLVAALRDNSGGQPPAQSMSMPGYSNAAIPSAELA